MDRYKSLTHSVWECEYHVVFIPKYRRKILYGGLRKHLGDVFRRLAEQKESRIAVCPHRRPPECVGNSFQLQTCSRI